MEQASTSTPRVTKAAWAHFIIIMSHFKAASETSLIDAWSGRRGFVLKARVVGRSGT